MTLTSKRPLRVSCREKKSCVRREGSKKPRTCRILFRERRRTEHERMAGARGSHHRRGERLCRSAFPAKCIKRAVADDRAGGAGGGAGPGGSRLVLGHGREPSEDRKS